MKYLLISVTAFLLSSCAVQQQHFISIDSKRYPVDVEAVDASIFLMNKAWKSHEEKYTKEEDHKAFAQSKHGAWAWQGNFTSAEQAIQHALDSCRKNNKKHEPSLPCLIVKVGDKWGAELELDR